jgi:uncharacterized cupin superfamily protein
MLAGEVILAVGDVSSTLQAGDSFLFDGVIPHDVHNSYDQSAKLLWIIAKLPNSLLIWRCCKNRRCRRAFTRDPKFMKYARTAGVQV